MREKVHSSGGSSARPLPVSLWEVMNTNGGEPHGGANCSPPGQKAKRREEETKVPTVLQGHTVNDLMTISPVY